MAKIYTDTPIYSVGNKGVVLLLFCCNHVGEALARRKHCQLANKLSSHHKYQTYNGTWWMDGASILTDQWYS